MVAYTTRGRVPTTEQDAVDLATKIKPLLREQGLPATAPTELRFVPEGQRTARYEHQYLAHQLQVAERSGMLDHDRVLFCSSVVFETQPEFIALTADGDRLGRLLITDPRLRRRALELGFRVLGSLGSGRLPSGQSPRALDFQRGRIDPPQVLTRAHHRLTFDERELARRFGIARNTAREAIRLLTEEALVTAQHGRGVFVREKQRMFRWGSGRYSRRTYRETGLTPFRLEMQRQGKTPRVEVTSIEQITPSFDVAERLKASPEEPSVLRRCNTYYADDEPIQVVTTYIRWADAEGTPLLQPKTGPGGIYGRLEERGHTMTAGQDEIIARMASHHEAQTLNLPSGVPVLEVLHTSIDQDDKPFEVSNGKAS